MKSSPESQRTRLEAGGEFWLGKANTGIFLYRQTFRLEFNFFC